MSKKDLIVEDLKCKVNKLKLKFTKQPDVKIPAMGFSEAFYNTISLVPESYSRKKDEIDGKVEDEDQEAASNSQKLSDQEILESTEAIYFTENVDTGIYELQKLAEGDFKLESIDKNMMVLKNQQKVISKKVLQMILDKRSSCNQEFQNIGETEKLLQESVWVCQKARSYLNFAKKQLTTTSLEILATYKKREVLIDLLETLKTLKNMKTTDQQLQTLLQAANYSGAISILLENKNQSEKYNQYKCIESLSHKLQDTLILTEVQLDNALNEIPQNFDQNKYSQLLEAYKLLGKIHLAMDQLHMNFISAIHTTAFNMLKQHLDHLSNDKQQKLLFEQMCENVQIEKYIVCLTSLCKAFWQILVCYYQVKMWHHNYKLYNSANKSGEGTSSKAAEDLSNDEYIQEKLKKGQTRIWNDIQAKICIYITSAKIHQLKYEHFIQILSIVQRLKKVGLEFCDDPCEKLLESMKKQSVEFFKSYHLNCLDEINLFLDHEIWIQVHSFGSVVQLQEYKSVKRALTRHKLNDNDGHKLAILSVNTPTKRPIINDNDSSVHSQDESSIYGSCGYFVRFCEKSSPFDGGFDQSMLEEDILSGIADETSCYYSEDSSDNDVELNNNNNHEIKNDSLTVNNTTINVLRVIGRYLQMCRLLHSISPYIILKMTEIIDFYIFAVYDFFGRDLPVSGDNLYSEELNENLKRISEKVISKIKGWPPSCHMIEQDLKDPEQLYGLVKRINGMESCIALIQQFSQLHGYLQHLILSTKTELCPENDERIELKNYIDETSKYIYDLRVIYFCVTSRVVDIPNILLAMNKVKWEINHITVEHSSYVDIINRNLQIFVARLEEIAATNVQIPKEALWDSLAHVITHLLVEGFSNAKKCSTGGRALMQLDFTHFLSVLSLLSGMKHPIHQQYVEQYVKAFYLPKDLLEEWIVEQKGYSTKHKIGLIQCTCSNDKKLRQRLMALVENNDKN